MREREESNQGMKNMISSRRIIQVGPEDFRVFEVKMEPMF